MINQELEVGDLVQDSEGNNFIFYPQDVFLGGLLVALRGVDDDKAIYVENTVFQETYSLVESQGESPKNQANHDQAKIDEIMDNFEFSAVAKTMEMLNWTWGDSELTPDEPMLRSRARKILNSVISDNSDFQSAGGFTARNTNGLLSLAFEVSTWEAD